jgi:transporter family-2 protein
MFALGVLASLQPPVNAALARRTGALPATSVSFIVGTLALVLVTVALGQTGGFSFVRGAPLWQLCGGLIGAVFVFGTVVLIPRLGAAGVIAAMIAGQLAGGMLIDRLGLFGLSPVGFTPFRVVGLVLLIGGGLLIVHR